MKKSFKALVFAVMMAVAVAALVPTTVQAASVSRNNWGFSGTEQTVYVGQQGTVKYYSSISGNSVTYKVSNNKILSVDVNGNFTAKKSGKVKVTISDGVHNATTTITVKALKKSAGVVLNYADGYRFAYGKTYTIKDLNGNKISKISVYSGKVKISGTKITVNPKKDGTADISFSLWVKTASGLVRHEWRCSSSQTQERAASIIDAAIAADGVSKNSSDLEKAIFAYNWVANNQVYDSPCSGSYHGIIEGKGNCTVFTESFNFIANRLGLWTVKVTNKTGNHECSGVRVNGKWYLVDCQISSGAYDFASGNATFLRSVNTGCTDDYLISSKNELTEITFTNTEFDQGNYDWSAYKSLMEQQQWYIDHEATLFDPDWDE